MTRAISLLNRKEMFSGSMVIFIGLFYILSFSSSLLQAKTVNISTALLLLELKWLLSGLLYLTGGILLFRIKQAGWVICAATLLNFVLIVFMNIVTLSQTGNLHAYAAITIGFFVLLLMAFIFLFTRSTRLKFRVTNKSYLLTIAVYLMLVTVTFWV